MEVDLPNILKRCSSAPVFIAGSAVLSNKNENINLTTNKNYEKQKLPNSISIAQKNLIQDKIITSLTDASNASNYSSGLSLFQSNSACSSPVRSREASPAPYNIFAPRARRYSASFAASVNSGINGPRLTPRVSQLRQEECVDANSREVNHEREIHSAMQMSQSWEDLTLVAENWSCKSEDLNSALQLALPTNTFLANRQCSSPSPTSRVGMKLNLLSPSPTRRTFATRRSMSPIAMRPSQLGPVKRKFELEDGNWNLNYSPPQKKKSTQNRCNNTSESFHLPSSSCPNLQSENNKSKTLIAEFQTNIDSKQISAFPRHLILDSIVQSKCSTENELTTNGIIKNMNEAEDIIKPCTSNLGSPSSLSSNSDKCTINNLFNTFSERSD